MHASVRPVVSFGIFAFCVIAAGCESTPRHRDFPEQSGAPRPIAMRGEATFFDRAVRAEVTLARGRPTAILAGEDERTPSGGRRGRGSGRRHGGGGMGGMSGERESGGDGDSVRVPVERPVGMPPLTLRLKLENLSSEPQDVLIHDFTSDLGNFAVRPEHVVLAPGQTVEVDPMVTQLGAMADELPVTVVLRAKGKTETQVVTVKNIATPKG